MPLSQEKSLAVKKLWLRINERGDFPLLSASLRTTIKAMQHRDYDFPALVQVVLSDFSLTHRVLRLANSAMYMAFGGNVTTVSRALTVLGLEAVAHVVLGMKLVDHFQQSEMRRTDAKLELNRAMLAGLIARKTAELHKVPGGEEAVVCTLMRQLGKLLCLFYLEHEWNQIRSLAQREACTEDEACMALLGLRFEDLGVEVAQRWGLPLTIREGMLSLEKDLAQGDATQAPTGIRWLQAVGEFSTQLSHALTVSDVAPGPRAAQVERVVDEYAEVLALPRSLVDAIIDGVRNDPEALSYIKEIGDLHAQAEFAERDPVKVIRLGLADLRMLSSDRPLAPVLSMASETLLAGLRLSRAVVFVRSRSGVFEARVGLGQDVKPLLEQLQFSASFEVDVFHLAINSSAGIFIENVGDPKFAAHIPAWFSRVLPDSKAFLLLPIRAGDGAVALMYGDWNDAAQVRKILPAEMTALNELASEVGRFFVDLSDARLDQI